MATKASTRYNQPVFETLYKTNAPEQLAAAEYYQPHLDVENVNGRPIYFVREKHGWYDASHKPAAKHSLHTLNPEDGYATWEEAERRYNEQLAHRAREGFVHSFSVDPFSSPPISYRRIVP